MANLPIQASPGKEVKTKEDTKNSHGTVVRIRGDTRRNLGKGGKAMEDTKSSLGTEAKIKVDTRRSRGKGEEEVIKNNLGMEAKIKEGIKRSHGKGEAEDTRTSSREGAEDTKEDKVSRRNSGLPTTASTVKDLKVLLQTEVTEDSTTGTKSRRRMELPSR